MVPALRLVATGTLILAAVGLTLGLAELAVRANGWLAPQRSPAVPARPEAALRGLPELRGWAQVGGPDRHGVHRGVLHRTNSRGGRGPEYSPEPAAGSYRIVVAGDSWVMGHRVEEELTYAAQVEAKLNEEKPHVRWEVINTGLSGLNIGGMLGRLERVGLSYAPHLVVYGFTPNDIYGRGYQPNTNDQRQAFVQEMERYEASPSHLLRLLWPRWIALRSALRPLPGSYEYALHHNYFERPDAWEKIERGFHALAQLRDERGVCFHVLIHPVIHQLDFLHPFRSIYDRVEEAARRYGLSVTQALPVFLGHRASDLLFGGDDDHPNAEGHRLLAEALQAGLADVDPDCNVPLTPAP